MGLANFIPTAEAEERLLKDPNLPYRRRCIYLVRRSERQILQRYMNLAQEVLPLLALPQEAFTRALEERVHARKGAVDYFLDLAIHLGLPGVLGLPSVPSQK